LENDRRADTYNMKQSASIEQKEQQNKMKRLLKDADKAEL
jgi:hypothetical protein